MTSLVLFNSEQSQPDDNVKPGFDWGTAKRRARSSSDPNWSHGSGTFLYSGEPISQTYRNTDITLSNVRINDELIPAPLHTTDITPHQIPLKFPSNHPFSSHISEKTLFPNASFSLDDRPSTDTDPYIVTHKIRGNPFRREVHYQGLQRQRQWPDKHYMHLPRSLSDLSSSSIYPWPRKLLAPNEECIPNSATNIVKNKGKTLLETTYQGDYSNGEGLGSHVLYDTTAILSSTEKLKPHFNKILDPARSIEAMQAIQIHGNHRKPSSLERQRTSIQYVPTETTKIMSEDEKLDDHMRNGTDYANLPANMFPTDRAATWIPRSEVSNNDSHQPGGTNEIRFLHHLRPSTIVPQIAHDHQASHQQIAAENRLQQLEVIRPEDNMKLLNLKFRTLQNSRYARPSLPQHHDAYVNTFYDQVGTYVQERSGLYHTESYDPTALIQSVPELANQEGDDNALLHDEHHLGDLLDYGEQTQDKSKPKLFQYKAIGDYQAMRNRLVNKFRVPQDSSTVDTRIQEGNKPFIQRESVYGQSYNTRKFLQENTLSHHARADPSRLISTKYNNDLERVRNINSFPKKLRPTQSFNNHEEKSNDILMGPLLHPSPYDELYSTKYITEHTDGHSRRSTNRVYDSPFKTKQDMTVFKFYGNQTATPVQAYFTAPGQLTQSAKTVIHLPGPEVVSRFLEPSLEPHSTYQHSFKDVSYHEVISPMQDSRINTDHQRLSMKDNDQRFGRTSDGRVKQWKLIDLQDHWTKTKAQRQYHVDHPESVPYVGDSTMRAKIEILIADNIDRQRMMTVR